MRSKKVMSVTRSLFLLLKFAIDDDHLFGEKMIVSGE